MRRGIYDQEGTPKILGAERVHGGSHVTEMRRQLLATIREHFPLGSDPAVEVKEESTLTDLRITSLHLISLITTLQDEYNLDVDQIAEHGMPVTMGDLITMIECGRRD